MAPEALVLGSGTVETGATGTTAGRMVLVPEKKNPQTPAGLRVGAMGAEGFEPPTPCL